MTHDPESPDQGPGRLETRFGVFDAGPEDVVRMIEPLPGFEACGRYVLLSSAAIAPLTCVQGLDGPRPSFLTLNPALVDPAFPLVLGEEARRRLGAPADAPLLWLAIVRLEADRAFANLRAPLVINPATMRGLQWLTPESAYDVDVPVPLG